MRVFSSVDPGVLFIGAGDGATLAVPAVAWSIIIDAHDAKL